MCEGSDGSRVSVLLVSGLMAANLSGSEANRLLNQFYSMDSDFSGTIELSELAKVTQQVRYGGTAVRHARSSAWRRDTSVAGSGHAVGVMAQLHFFLDDMFPRSFGRPLVGH